MRARAWTISALERAIRQHAYALAYPNSQRRRGADPRDESPGAFRKPPASLHEDYLHRSAHVHAISRLVGALASLGAGVDLSPLRGRSAYRKLSSTLVTCTGGAA